MAPLRRTSPVRRPLVLGAVCLALVVSLGLADPAAAAGAGASTSARNAAVRPTAKAAKPTAAQVKGARRAAGKGGVTALRTLHALPGSAGVHIVWDDPDLGSHLGGVRIGSTSTVLLNSRRLSGRPALARDVVRHEIAHIYQGRLMRTHHLTWAQLGRRLAPTLARTARRRSPTASHARSALGGPATPRRARVPRSVRGSRR